ncbi:MULTISPECIES: hypothetical protein [Lysinibacillus]|uniref:hypothetical protein n=1 Tax=Lysinibacillus TaxID=400634 RepID=UPI00237EC5E8|nr:hypothetical protein [Lysinibacillus sp. G01H]UNT57050.1 hypothetical protein ICJ70_08545 [Lysinibacillus capsici]WDU78156.1 hypothetical protein PSR12_15865 [Lysinibacillus sp. G01H]
MIGILGNIFESDESKAKREAEKNINKVTTITPDEFNKLEKGMSLDEVQKVVGGKPKNPDAKENDDLLLFLDYDGENGVSENSSVSLIFKDGKLNTLVESGLLEPKQELSKEEKEKIEENIAQIKSKVSTDEVEKIITDNLGENNNSKKKVIEKIDATDNSLNLTLNASDNFTLDMMKRGMWMDSIKVLEPLSKVNNIKLINVDWQLPLVDKFGNEKDAAVMKFSIDKATLDKINWDNFLTENFPDVVSNYEEHPALNKK